MYPSDRGAEKALTITAYQRNVAEFVLNTSTIPRDVVDAIAAFVGLCRAGGRVLEIGSASGRDADLLEEGGVVVDRTDVTPAFVDMMRARGRVARVLDPLTDELGGPYDGVWANAVLLHLGREELPTVLQRLHRVVRPGGVLFASVKRGRGEAWSTHGTITLPRHSTFWEEDAWLAAHHAAGWKIRRAWTTTGQRDETWLSTLALA